MQRGETKSRNRNPARVAVPAFMRFDFCGVLAVPACAERTTVPACAGEQAVRIDAAVPACAGRATVPACAGEQTVKNIAMVGDSLQTSGNSKDHKSSCQEQKGRDLNLGESKSAVQGCLRCLISCVSIPIGHCRWRAAGSAHNHSKHKDKSEYDKL